jgi:methionyl-tRNA formyltransferase
MENYKMKIVFFGTSEFGAVILEKLIKNRYRPILVVTAPDKPAGRKQIPLPPPVKITAQNYNVSVFQPENMGALKLKIKNLMPNLIIAAAYGRIIPQEILDLPSQGSLNVHPSLLPKYRGPSPIQTAILNGDKETGATIILMTPRIDAGPVLAQKKTIIGSNETAKELQDRLADLAGELLVDVLPDWTAGRIKLRTQKEKEATYTKTLKRENGEIDWKEPLEKIERQIRAFYPWPGSYTIVDNKRIKILKAGIEKREKKFCLAVKELQVEGKKPISFEDFKRGYPNLLKKFPKKIC